MASVSHQILFTGSSSSSSGVLDSESGIITGAYSFSRNLLSSFSSAKYTDTSGAIDTWVDQTGNSRTFANTGTARPTLTTAGGVACADFDGSNDWLNTVTSAKAVSQFITASTGWIIISFKVDAIATNDGTVYNNDPLFGDAGAFMGIYLRNTGTPGTLYNYNFDGSVDTVSAADISTATPYVIEYWHTGGNLFRCINNGTPTSTASGDLTNLTNTVGVGHGYTGSSVFLNGQVWEMAMASSVPATRSTIAANWKTYIGA